MVNKIILFLLVSLFTFFQVKSQTCTTLGQNPSTAFPVCGTSAFSQGTVPLCGGRSVPGGVCSGSGTNQAPLTDINPFWYKFTCFKAGTLGFLITPNNLSDDYDWQLFDITGHDPGDIYTNTSLFVACNWSGNTGLTGASPSGRSLQNCAGTGYPTFSQMPVLKLNHNYLLLISHFTQSQDGYKLSFGGGTGSITDTILPNIISATPSCDAMKIVITLNKKMLCSSLAEDGSDFNISPAGATITAATGNTCSNGFDMNTITLSLNGPLAPGNYNVILKNGSDSNTLLDFCGRNISPGKNVPFTVTALKPTLLDSISPVGCAPESLKLVFKKGIECNSIADDGSDFIVTGPSTVSVIGAVGNCSSGVSNMITVMLSAPILTQGNYQIKLVNGSDSNTIIDQCGQETPASFLNFSTVDTVSADFTYTTFKGCSVDSIAFSQYGGNGINQWSWNFADGGRSNLQNPTAYFKTFGNKQINLIVSNGVCSDSATKTINLDNTLKAAFETNNMLCPEDTAVFINNSLGNITNYYWDFGDGNSSTSKTPAPVKFPILNAEKIYAVMLTVKNAAGCTNTALNNISVLKSCYIAVPNAFTPNGDGLNDYLYPLNAYKADDLEFSVYNRLGQRVFYTTDWTKKWDGTINGNPQDAGIYVWLLKYTNHDTGKKIFQKGSTILIR